MIRTPVVRVPVTREGLVALIVHDMATDFQKDLFADLLMPLVKSNMKKVYGFHTIENAQDIESDCIVHVFSQLHKYKQDSGVQFVTWVWTVIRNKMIQLSSKIVRHSKVLTYNNVGGGEDGDIDEPETNDTFSHDLAIRETVRTIIDKNEEHADVLYGLLGDPDGVLQDKINFSRVSRETGKSVVVVTRVFNDVVIPSFRYYRSVQ